LNSTGTFYTPNIISSDGFVSPYITYTLMGFTTFVVVHPNYSTKFSFMNKCVIPKSKK
jgi:hypothetical protein